MDKCKDCKGCKFFVRYAKIFDNHVGRCHRYPPVFLAEEVEWVFPTVNEDEWCGEYKNIYML